jgi:hypothetical protein
MEKLGIIFGVLLIVLILFFWIGMFVYLNAYEYVDTFCYVVNNIEFNGSYMTVLKDINSGTELNIINNKELYQDVANWKIIKIRVKQYAYKARYFNEFIGPVE